MWYEDTGVLILKTTVSPLFTLICVEKPVIVVSPSPTICQSFGEVPGNVFSHATGLTTGASHGPTAPAGGVPSERNNPTLKSATRVTPVTATLATRRLLRTNCPPIWTRPAGPPVTDRSHFCRHLPTLLRFSHTVWYLSVTLGAQSGEGPNTRDGSGAQTHRARTGETAARGDDERDRSGEVRGPT